MDQGTTSGDDLGSDGPDARIRAFFALMPDDSARARLAVMAGEVARRCRGRMVLSEHVHLTLAFIGDVPGEAIESLCVAGDKLSKDGAMLEFDLLGAWRASGVAWIAPSSIPPQVLALHDELATVLGGAGFTVDARPFRPHVTLARRCVSPPQRARCAPIPWRVDRLCLIGSVLRPEGPLHRELRSWPLRVAAPPDHRAN